jgi:hypothetical protein
MVEKDQKQFIADDFSTDSTRYDGIAFGSYGIKEVLASSMRVRTDAFVVVIARAGML